MTLRELLECCNLTNHLMRLSWSSEHRNEISNCGSAVPRVRIADSRPIKCYLRN